MDMAMGIIHSYFYGANNKFISVPITIHNHRSAQNSEGAKTTGQRLFYKKF